MNHRGDVKKAIDYLKNFPNTGLWWFTPEELKQSLGLKIGVPALARRLRDSRSTGEIEARVRFGKTYKEYAWVVKI
jgi:hypothetical protein